MANELTAESIQGLNDLFNPKYVGQEILERIISDLPNRPVTLAPGVTIPARDNLPQHYRGLNLCLGCRRIYEITQQREAFVLNEEQTSEPGPYCGPCTRRILTKNLME